MKAHMKKQNEKPNRNDLTYEKPGTGMRLASKREIDGALASISKDMIILDPEGEYLPLIQNSGLCSEETN